MRKRLFLRRFQMYFIMILLPLVLSLLIYSTLSRQSQMRDAHVTTLQSLERVEDSISLSLKSATYQRNLFTGAPRLMTSLKKILSKNTMNYSDVVFIDCIKILINQSLNSNLNIHSVYLYLDGYDRFLCSDKGIQPLNGFVDSQWHSLYEAHNQDEYTWTYLRNYLEYNRPIDMISVYLRLVNAKGIIVVNLNPERIQTMIDKTYFNQNEAVFLLSSSYEVLLNNHLGTLYMAKFGGSPNNYIDLTAISPMTPTKIAIAGTQYYATLTPLSEYGYQLLSLMKESDYYTFSSYINTTIILQSISAVIMALLIALFVTIKNIRQFHHLLNVFDDAEKGVFHQQERPKYLFDEFDMVVNNVIKTYLSNESLKNELAEKQYLKTKTELIALQLQINPHFLFNSLQLLDNQAYILTNRFTDLNNTIQKLSAILKYALASPQEVVTLREELEQTHSYADINYKRYEKMFILYFDYDEDILSHHVFRLLLQPIIENCLHHGIVPLNRSRMGLIKVKIYKRNESLHFRIIDNGAGMTREKLEQLRLVLAGSNISTSHIGLSNTNTRLILYFGHQSQINITSKQNLGTGIHFQIPLIDCKEDFNLT